MKLKLERFEHQAKATIGKLYIDDVFECYTLEDVVRDAKIQNETAIPAGTYQVLITWSPRFQRQLPLIVEVQGFDGIRIHPGNTDKDTDGCILVGKSYSEDFITDSRVTFDALYQKLLTDKNNLSIEIS